MKTVAFSMQLKPGFETEYKKRHDDIWPELSELLKEAGICDYHIFLEEDTGTLIGVQVLKQGHTTAALRSNDIMKKWWDYMADIMETNPDHSPVVKPLRMLFDLK